MDAPYAFFYIAIAQNQFYLDAWIFLNRLSCLSPSSVLKRLKKDISETTDAGAANKQQLREFL